MKLGFFTSALPKMSLEQLAQFASSNGFDSLEVAVWPDTGPRPFTATHIDVGRLDEDGAKQVRDLVDRHGLEISSLGFYDNNLHPDEATRRSINGHVETCVRAAALLGCPTVGTFIGRDPGATVSQNLRDAELLFPRYVDIAGELGVRLVVENCVMEGWHPDGYPGNLAYSPELWEWMFSLGLYLNFDPSHLIWMGIDPVVALAQNMDKVAHFQAKDIHVSTEMRNRFGYPGRAVNRIDPWDVGYWDFKVPGRGDVDWQSLVGVLDDAGYTGTVSIEHEDATWGETEDRVKAGLLAGRDTLSPLLTAVSRERDGVTSGA